MSLALLTVLTFAACYTDSANIDLCSIENDTLWYLADRDTDIFKMSRRSFNGDDEDRHLVTYQLYTRLNPTTPQLLVYDDSNSINNSNFDVRNVTVVLIHGWLGDANSSMNTLLSEAFLQNAAVNVIVVDWSYWASYNYVASLLAVPRVGTRVGDFVKWLTGFGLPHEKLHLVGFSLGSHVAGKVGKRSKSKIQRITALDPAGVLGFMLSDRLYRTDAKYVEVIHTNGRFFGLREPCGDADFYPNGGEHMPNCWLNMCSHSMAYQYLAESINNNNMMANWCGQFNNVVYGNCSGVSFPMGNSDLSKNISGLFRIDVISGRRSYSQGYQSQSPGSYDKELCY